MIAIIDYDAGNIKSVEKACNYLGYDTVVSSNSKEIIRADKVILPGVGSFGNAMSQLQKYHLDHTIREIVSNDVPFLGICLGMQLLFDSSEESYGVNGLGILKGNILKIPSKDRIKIPHIGWNSLDFINDGRLFNNMEPQPYVYFVHSYYLQAEDKNIVKATCQYGVNIHASVESGNIFACQFHPEKSGDTGLQILTNFAQI